MFGLLGTVASLGGSKLNHSVNPQVLLLAFAGLMIIAATGMISRSRKPSEDIEPETPHSTQDLYRTQPRPPAAAPVPHQTATPPTPGTVITAATAEAAAETQSTGGVSGIIKVVAAALMVGFLTGFFGVGGGFVIVPAVVVALRYKMPTAVGTSLIIIAINSAGALTARICDSSIPWHVVVPFTAASIVGSPAGLLL